MHPLSAASDCSGTIGLGFLEPRGTIRSVFCCGPNPHGDYGIEELLQEFKRTHNHLTSSAKAKKSMAKLQP